MPELIKINPAKFDPGIDLPDISLLMNMFVKECINMEEKLLIEIMTQVLNREPTIEDFKECTRITHPWFEPNDYIIAYKNIKLGFVKHDYNGSSVTVTFTPDAGTY
jgi:hypothetical protein